MLLLLSENYTCALLFALRSAKVVQALQAIQISTAKTNLRKGLTFLPYDTVKLKEVPTIISFQIQRN